jgi:hypothetical protein
MTDQTYIVGFIFAGLFWAGLLAVALAVYIGFQRITNNTPTPDEKRWTRDWESIEEKYNE